MRCPARQRHALRAKLREAIILSVETTRMRTQIYGISVMPLLLLLLAVVPAARAQLVGLPQYGVLLSGTADDPVVLNQSPHRILAFALRQGKGRMFISNQAGLSQLTRGNGGPDGPGIPPGGTSLSLPQVGRAHMMSASGRADIGFTDATLDGVLFDDGLFVGPDLGHVYESITARIAAEISVGSILLSAKTDGELAAAWDQIKQIAETPVVHFIPPTGTITGPPVPDPNSPRQFAQQLLLVKDRLGEQAAVAQAAASRTYPKIHKE
jgi:hypothetical protein